MSQFSMSTNLNGSNEHLSLAHYMESSGSNSLRDKSNWKQYSIKSNKPNDRQIFLKTKTAENNCIKECIDEPIDLTFSQKVSQAQSVSSSEDSGIESERGSSSSRQSADLAIYDEAASNTSIAIAKIMEVDHYMSNTNVPKKRGRKRKTNEFATISEKTFHIPNVNLNVDHVSENSSEYLQNMDQKQAEVLKAAKSLFSKRTRTLYHWMYPNTPKSQLKAAVSMSWETLGIQEKEFYISQVLGRFGFPQNSLMVNPQLDGIKVVPPLFHAHISIPPKERKTMPLSSSLPNDSEESYIIKPPRISVPMLRNFKKKGRIGRPPGSKNKQIKHEETLIKQIQCDSNGDEFQDDPELSREFEQFKWTLHLNDKNT